MTPTPAAFTHGSKSPSKPTECLEHIVRFDETGDAVAVVYFTVWQHHLDFFVLQPYGIVNPTTDRVLGVIEAPDRAEVFAEGSLKWSGCINFSVGEEGHYAHACDSEMLHKLFSHVEWVYTLGPKIPAWEGGE